MKLTEMERLAAEAGCTVQQNVPLSTLTTFRIGGPADLLITAPTASAVSAVIRAAAAEMPLFFLGSGSNLLVGDGGIRGAVLKMAPQTPVLCADGVTVTVGAGTSLAVLCRFARDNGLSGLEFAYGIPGSVGGAVYMNAGAYGGQMADVVVNVTAVDGCGNTVEITNGELHYGYRESALMRGDLRVVEAKLRLHPADRAEITAAMEHFTAARLEKQPLEYASAGSFFKRPEGYFAGALIEQSGLKGAAVGGAQISEKHAGFLINRGGATARDVCRLSKLVQEKVFADHGVHLEPEVRFVGEFTE